MERREVSNLTHPQISTVEIGWNRTGRLFSIVSYFSALVQNVSVALLFPEQGG